MEHRTTQRAHTPVQGEMEKHRRRKGRQTSRGYADRTPAMAAGLADHIWSVEELLLYPVG